MVTSELIKLYFSSKSQQLIAASNEAICEHPGLKGSHREDVIKIYLQDILPKKFEIGKGMIYGIAHKSKEADIVIWDSYNYPSIQLKGHSLFFSESARMMIEVKTTFSNDTLMDILNKSQATKNIASMRGLSLEDELFMLQAQVGSILSGQHFEGILHSKPHTATAAFIFRGGNNFTLSQISDEIMDEADDMWPDIIIFLEAGKVILKHYEEDNYIELIDAKEDSLLLFTSSLLGLLTDRSVNIEDPFYLTKYSWDTFKDCQTETRNFRLTRPSPGRRII